MPDITGLESKPKANVGEVKSQGFDGNFALKQKLGEVDMTIRGNITYSKNEVLERMKRIKSILIYIKRVSCRSS